MQKPVFTQYPTPAAIGDLMRNWVDTISSHARLVERLEEVGRSRAGSELWAKKVSDTEVGRPEDKPAISIDGNMHAGEILPSVVCLLTIWDLLSRYRHDERATDLLKTRIFLVRPRVAPVGAEHVLTTADRLHSSTKAWPRSKRAARLHPSDLDGDRHVLQMRQVDPLGEWRVSESDNRLVVQHAASRTAGAIQRIVGLRANGGRDAGHA